MTSFNLFINDFNKLRNFSRLLYIYGCYSRDDINKFQISDRTYDNELRRIRLLLNEKNIRHYKISKKEYKYIGREFISTTPNPLINIYFAKKTTKNELILFILIQQVLYLSNTPLTVDELEDRISSNLINPNDDFSESTFKRILKNMIQYGYIVEIADVNPKKYKLGINAKDIIDKFSPNELEAFLNLIDYYTNTFHPSVPGTYFYESVKCFAESYYKMNFNIFFRYIYNNYHQILDEEYVWTFLEAIDKSKYVTIYYKTRKGKRHKYNCIPIKAVLDIKNGRWYVVVLNKNAPISLPVHRIENIDILDESYDESILEDCNTIINKCYFVSIPKKLNKFYQVELLFNSETDNKFLIKRVKRELSIANIKKIDDKSFEVKALISNLKEFKPWLLSFGHRVIIKNKDILKKFSDEIYTELKEMLNNYESVHGV